MVPFRLVLAVQDEQYIEPFLHYVRCSEYQQKILVTAFSQKDAFLRYVEESRNVVHVVLGEPYFMESNVNSKELQIPWICLGQGEGGNRYAGEVSKYQPLHLLLSAVLDLYKGGGGVRTSSEGKCPVIGIYSALGGSGKTTVALNMAKQLGMQGNRVFYLNLETVNAGIISQGETNGGSQRSGLARLLYDLKGDDKRRQSSIAPISAYAIRSHILRSDIFSPLDNLNEMLEMEEKDTVDLIDYIADRELYDAVIVDVDSSLNNRSKAVLERSDKLVWLLTDDWGCMRKTDLWLSHLERSYAALHSTVMNKAMFVVNRCLGEMTTALPRKGIMVEATLSFISSWNQGIQQGALLHSPVFQRDVLRLCRELYSKSDVNGSRRAGG